MKRKEIDHYMRSTGANIFSIEAQCLKITEKGHVASYVYILSGQGLIKNAKKNWRVFKN